MNWDAIGAVGQVVGAVGVVVTLFYLATQIRQNSKQLAAQSRFNFYQTRVSISSLPLSDRELFVSVGKSVAGEPLDPIEMRKLLVFGMTTLTAWEYEVGEVQQGRLSLEEFNPAAKRRVFDLLPHLRNAWETYRITAPKAFVEFVERHVVGPPT